MASGGGMGWKQRHVAGFFCQNYMHMIFEIAIKTLLANFQTNFMALAALGSCHVTERGKRNLAIFEVLRAYLRESLTFFIARSYRVLVVDIKGLIISVLVTLETRIIVPILAICDDFWHF